MQVNRSSLGRHFWIWVSQPLGAPLPPLLVTLIMLCSGVAQAADVVIHTFPTIRVQSSPPGSEPYGA
jgi:hypothetical protein